MDLKSGHIEYNTASPGNYAFVKARGHDNLDDVVNTCEAPTVSKHRI